MSYIPQSPPLEAVTVDGTAVLVVAWSITGGESPLDVIAYPVVAVLDGPTKLMAYPGGLEYRVPAATRPPRVRSH